MFNKASITYFYRSITYFYRSKSMLLQDMMIKDCSLPINSTLKLVSEMRDQALPIIMITLCQY